MLRTLALLALAAGTAAAQPDPKKADDKPVTKVYSVKSLTGDRGKAGVDADAVVKLIFQAIPELRDSRPGTDGPQIVERDGGRLEVRAPEKVHDEVKNLLAALERLQDVAVDVKVEVLEFGTGFWYDQNVKPLFRSANGKPESPVAVTTEAGAWWVFKEVRAFQTSSERLANGAEATVSARRTLATFSNVPGGDVKKDERPLFVKEGFTLQALPVVSADRRSVRFKLTEQSTAITGVRKREFGEIGGKKMVAETPDTDDLGATGSAVVPDGGVVLFKLAYAPKDRVWVVVLRPTIFIQAEEDERKKDRKK